MADMPDVVPITADIWMLRFAVVNAYLLRVDSGFAVIDTATLGSDADVLAALTELGGDRAALRQIVLTHCHKDHAGAAAALATETGATVLAGASDAPVVDGTSDEPVATITVEERPFFDKIPTIPPAPPVRVDRVLRDGENLEWVKPAAMVVEVPGHTPGSIAIYLPGERVLFAGDNIASVDGRPILGPFNVARHDAIASFRKLAQLNVEIACFGHGDPILRDAGAALNAEAKRL